MYGSVYHYNELAASQPTRAEVLAHHLYRWWLTLGQRHFLYSPWLSHRFAITSIPSHQEQVRAVAAELAQDAELMQVDLCTFLGTPEGKLIATAVELAVPQPYRLVVQEALNLICEERGAGRRTLVGLGAVGAIGALVLFFAVAAK